MNLETYNQIKELEFLSGYFDSMNQFTDFYEAMLNEAAAVGEKEKMRSMQRVLFKQAEYLVSEWLKEKAIEQDEIM